MATIRTDYAAMPWLPCSEMFGAEVSSAEVLDIEPPVGEQP